MPEELTIISLRILTKIYQALLGRPEKSLRHREGYQSCPTQIALLCFQHLIVRHIFMHMLDHLTIIFFHFCICPFRRARFLPSPIKSKSLAKVVEMVVVIFVVKFSPPNSSPWGMKNQSRVAREDKAMPPEIAYVDSTKKSSEFFRSPPYRSLVRGMVRAFRRVSFILGTSDWDFVVHLQ